MILIRRPTQSRVQRRDEVADQRISAASRSHSKGGHPEPASLSINVRPSETCNVDRPPDWEAQLFLVVAMPFTSQ